MGRQRASVAIPRAGRRQSMRATLRVLCQLREHLELVVVARFERGGGLTAGAPARRQVIGPDVLALPGKTAIDG